MDYIFGFYPKKQPLFIFHKVTGLSGFLFSCLFSQFLKFSLNHRFIKLLKSEISVIRVDKNGKQPNMAFVTLIKHIEPEDRGFFELGGAIGELSG